MQKKKKVLICGWLEKCLLHKHKPELGPQHLHIKPGVALCASQFCAGERRCSLGLIGCQSSSRLSDRHLLKREIRQRVIGKDTWCFPLDSAYLPTHAYLCVPMHAHTCMHASLHTHKVFIICYLVIVLKNLQEKTVRYGLLETAVPINLRSENG